MTALPDVYGVFPPRFTAAVLPGRPPLPGSGGF